MTHSDDSNRLIDAGNLERGDNALRPNSLVDFIGQGNGRRNLETFIHAARDRGDAMDHTLLHGPPGLAKQRWHKLLLLNWELVFGRHQGSNCEGWRSCGAFNKFTAARQCCLLMKFIGWHRQLKKCLSRDGRFPAV